LVGSLVTAKVYNNRKVFCALGQPANCRTGPYIPLCPESVFTSAENARTATEKSAGGWGVGRWENRIAELRIPEPKCEPLLIAVSLQLKLKIQQSKVRSAAAAVAALLLLLPLLPACCR